MFNLHTLIGIGWRGKPGQWNDPDFLELPAMHSINAQRAHFSMWCITSSPLVYSSPLKTMHTDTLAILTDADAIAINQEYAGNAGDLLRRQGETVYICVETSICLAGAEGELWYKPLPPQHNSTIAAVALLNPQAKNGTTINMQLNLRNCRSCKELGVALSWMCGPRTAPSLMTSGQLTESSL